MSVNVEELAINGNQLIGDFVNRAGLEGGVIGSSEGLEIASYFRDSGTDSEIVAANAASLLSVGLELLESVGKNNLKSLIVESDDGYFSIKDLGSDVVLVVTTPKEFKMGGLIVSLKKFATELQEA